MADRRRYKQFCGLAKALDVVGERWTLLIVRDLILGPRRYSDLLEGLPGLTTNLLAERLRQLEEEGLVEKSRLPAPSGATVYRLKPPGRALEPTIMALAAWGGRYLGKPASDDAFNLGWGFLSLKRRYLGVKSPVTANVRVGDRLFHWALAPGSLALEEGLNAPAEVDANGTPAAFRALFFEGKPWEPLVRSKELELTGSTEAWTAFLAAFGPVPKAI